MTDSSPEVFIHVGLEKTGSTFLQYRVFPYLKDIYYLHRRHYEHYPQLANNLPASKTLISREYSHLIDDEVDRFSSLFPQAKPIIVLRRHDSWLLSQYKRYLKNGLLLDVDEFIDLSTNRGFFKKEDIYFLPKLQKLEDTFKTKPLVLFYDTLKENPQQFIQDLLRYMQVTVDYTKINYNPYRTAHSTHQLLAAKTYGKKLKKLVAPSNGPDKINKWVLRIIMYLGIWIYPNKNDTTLVAEQQLARIKDFYEDDWKSCIAYAQRG